MQEMRSVTAPRARTPHPVQSAQFGRSMALGHGEHCQPGGESRAEGSPC